MHLAHLALLALVMLVAGCLGEEVDGSTRDSACGTAEGAGGLEEGRPGLPEHTAAWAVTQALPTALAWHSDAVFSHANGASVAADGTNSWALYFFSPSTNDCEGAGLYEWCTDVSGDCGGGVGVDIPRPPINGWEVNSDDLVRIAGGEPEDCFCINLMIEPGLGYNYDTLDGHPVAIVGTTTDTVYIDASTGDILEIR